MILWNDEDFSQGKAHYSYYRIMFHINVCFIVVYFYVYYLCTYSCFKIVYLYR